ncbi:hypothetical protein P153DRAFT_362808 [Dothidotthia symphoricarpi CBS 119687]|uniref:F-box domain-containing protein n=1 Tax=Dothidotthia symphoricarpi CBS 119687 TaxID=1392245 RepID=A0A6A6ARD1_9PLEO|nr:uncharacterized protein P153DRAFT_362808 [Dothidotthia symphoricarpi CBS 119687]KAF2133728.1 hypothetical protein P153DRAFT_362808 [Dothidotthia symphoricarpi CBS 119687]
MTPITDLPSELLEPILSLLSFSSLSTLSRTCKILHAYLSPRIYHTIDWTWEDDQPCPPFHFLLRTLLANTQLAGLVRVLKFRGGGIVREDAWKDGSLCDDECDWQSMESARSVWTDGQRARSSFKREDEWRVEDCVSQIYNARIKEWMSEFDRGNIDVVVALILGQLQALEQLDLGFGFVQRSRFVPQLFRHYTVNHRSLVPYRLLVSANLALDGPRSPQGFWSDLDLYRLFFFLPSLRTLNTILIEPVIFAWPSPMMRPQTVSLSSLCLRKCTASGDTLSRILSHTSQLKHLVYDHHRMVMCYPPHWECEPQIYDPPTGWRRVSINCDGLSKALSYVRHTLQTLEIKVQFTPSILIELKDKSNMLFLCGLIGRITHLPLMTRLTSLEIPWVLLSGWILNPVYEGKDADIPMWRHNNENFNNLHWPSVLPASLTRLRLRDDLSDFGTFQFGGNMPIALIEQLLETKTTYLRELVDLEFVFIWNRKYEYEGCPLSLVKELRIVCHKYGVGCRIWQEQVLWKSKAAVEIQ